jgi:hypothetical protein
MTAVDWTTVQKLTNPPTATECDQRKFLSLIEVYIDPTKRTSSNFLVAS